MAIVHVALHAGTLATEILCCWTNTFSTVLSRAIVIPHPPVRNIIFLLYKVSMETHEAGR